MQSSKPQCCQWLRAWPCYERRMEGSDALLPFVSQFYGSPSTYFWEDEQGGVHEIREGEGGEQGDPLLRGSTAHREAEQLMALGRPLVCQFSRTYSGRFHRN